MAQRITVYEVGPRDGLQNEARVVPTEDKLRLLRLLADAGLSRIEATSFVSPKWIPALADASEVVAKLPARAGLVYVVLVPNAKGLERLAQALDAAGPARAEVDSSCMMSADLRPAWTRSTSSGSMPSPSRRNSPSVTSSVSWARSLVVPA